MNSSPTSSQHHNSCLHIASCASEMSPYAKTGGLADMVASLCLALDAKGVQIKAFIPRYSGVGEKTLSVSFGKKSKLLFVEHNDFFLREGIYGNQYGDYGDNLMRFAFFSQRVLELLKEQSTPPDIIHCHDWHTALVPLFLKTIYKNDPFFRQTKVLFTIHNLSYQGYFAAFRVYEAGLYEYMAQAGVIEHDSSVNLMKVGLLTADMLSTVSPSYAQEIQTPLGGCGFHNILSSRASSLVGILNGIDYAVWNPKTCVDIPCNYTQDSLQGKGVNKVSLQEKLGLEKDVHIPVAGVVSRLAAQKGIELIVAGMDELMQKGFEVVVLGEGDRSYYQSLQQLAQRYPGRFSVVFGFNPVLAQQIYAGSDMFFMPSLFEPCGLGQLISVRYGTIPVVRNTGGLRDTVLDYSIDPHKGNGFVFDEYNVPSFLAAVTRALELFRNTSAWAQLVKNAMRFDYSWAMSAEKYVQLYTRMKDSAQ